MEKMMKMHPGERKILITYKVYLNNSAKQVK